MAPGLLAPPVVPVPVPLLGALLAATTDRRADAAGHSAGSDRTQQNPAPTATGWALVLVEVDRYAGLTTLYGHQAAEQVLTRIARTLAAVTGPPSAVDRCGLGDLTALLPVPDRAAARTIGEDVRRAVSGLGVDVAGPSGCRRTIGTTVSVGIAVGSGVEPGKLLWAADAALYRSTRAGGDMVSVIDLVSDPTMPMSPGDRTHRVAGPVPAIRGGR